MFKKISNGWYNGKNESFKVLKLIEDELRFLKYTKVMLKNYEIEMSKTFLKNYHWSVVSNRFSMLI